MNDWIATTAQLPTQSTVVDTKIDDWGGVRNMQPLQLIGKLWFTADGSMYVYYTPTHWKMK